MPIYRDGENDIGVVIGQLSADNLSVNLEGVSVRSFLYGYDTVGANWDRLATSAAGLLVDTELPAAVLLADNAATPTAPAVGAFLMVYDGATWDFLRGNAVGGVFVQGPTADGIAVTGNPIQLGAVDAGGLVQRLRAEGVAGAETLRVSIGDPSNATPSSARIGTSGADAIAADLALYTLGFSFFYNGATWDRMRGDIANGLDVDVTRVSGTVTVDSELPAAALLADNAATPTAPAVGAFGMVYDGATWDFLRGNALGGAFVQGNVAQGVANSMNPVLVAGDDGGNARVPTLLTVTDGAAASFAMRTAGYAQLFNGTTYDRERNNHEITALASGARVATTTSASLTNYNAKGMLIAIDVTAVGAPAGTLTLLEVLTLVGTTEVVMYTFNFTNLGAVGTLHLMVYPGVAGRTAGAEGEAGGGEAFSVDPLNGVVPRVFRIRVTHLDGNSITYSVVCSMIN